METLKSLSAQMGPAWTPAPRRNGVPEDPLYESGSDGVPDVAAFQQPARSSSSGAAQSFRLCAICYSFPPSYQFPLKSTLLALARQPQELQQRQTLPLSPVTPLYLFLFQALDREVLGSILQLPMDVLQDNPPADPAGPAQGASSADGQSVLTRVGRAIRRPSALADFVVS
ncbi:hypothetical protein SKAU_G00156860 [Synaphobranchus kaupii]|uniref:Uncharacterized protein n=1 Tax=Synaphobranchus kaupii TaxID=118154 RepID=A0A9Q1IYG6_SYNKA|nr:hypothetical protein SKAU_G00156860 [Synaphobranchus kaupii]